MGEQRIAAIDDDPLWLALLGRVLTREGIESIAIEDEDRAVERIAALMPSVVLVDYRLKRTTGAEIARALHERLGADCPSLVLMTGDLTSVPAEERALFEGEIQKPLPLASLLHVVRAVLRRRRESGTQLRVSIDDESSGTG